MYVLFYILNEVISIYNYFSIAQFTSVASVVLLR